MKQYEYPELGEVLYQQVLPNGLTAAVVPRKGFSRKMAYFVTDITPLFGLQNMERLYLGRTTTKKDQYYAACEALPNCWVSRTWYRVGNISENYSVGWRLDEDGEYSDFYKEFREIFRYDEGFSNGVSP